MEGAMLTRSKHILRYYMLATKLTDKIRSGWDDDHWNVSKKRRESVAEHIFGTCVLALGFNADFTLDLDMKKVIYMLVLHDLGKAVIDDITPFDNITPEEKKKKEHEAVKAMVRDFGRGQAYYMIFDEFDNKKSKEGIFAYHIDKLQADLEAKILQDFGYHHSLDDQKNNVVFKSEKVQDILKNGAESPFDVWFEYDKSLYEDDPMFIYFLDYIRSVDTKEILAEEEFLISEYIANLNK